MLAPRRSEAQFLTTNRTTQVSCRTRSYDLRFRRATADEIRLWSLVAPRTQGGSYPGCAFLAENEGSVIFGDNDSILKESNGHTHHTSRCSPLNSLKINHAAIRVPDFDTAVAWYAEKLDFRLSARRKRPNIGPSPARNSMHPAFVRNICKRFARTFGHPGTFSASYTP